MKYKDWEIFDTMPVGFVVDKTAGSPLSGHIFITNGKSVLNNQVLALLKIEVGNQEELKPCDSNEIYNLVSKTENAQYDFHVESINCLARLKMKEN